MWSPTHGPPCKCKIMIFKMFKIDIIFWDVVTFFFSSSKITKPIFFLHLNSISYYYLIFIRILFFDIFFWQKHLHTWKPESTDKLYSDRLFCPINSIRAMTFPWIFFLVKPKVKPKHCPRILDLYPKYFCKCKSSNCRAAIGIHISYAMHEFSFILNLDSHFF